MTRPLPLRFLDLAADNIRDMLESFEPRPGWKRGLLAAALLLPAAVFAAALLRYDRRVGRFGPAAASAWLLRRYYAGANREGQAPPAKGGVLLLANHPGIGDSLALLASLEREDLSIIAHDRAFFRCLPNIYSLIIPVPLEEGRRAGVAPRVKRALREGRMVLLYPAGEIEPDPLLHPGDPMPFKEWTPLVGWLILRARLEGFDFSICTAVVEGVFDPAAFLAPWVAREADPARRERKAAAHAVIFRGTRRRTIRLRWSEILSAGSAVFAGADPLAATGLVRAAAAAAIAPRPEPSGSAPAA